MSIRKVEGDLSIGQLLNNSIKKKQENFGLAGRIELLCKKVPPELKEEARSIQSACEPVFGPLSNELTGYICTFLQEGDFGTLALVCKHADAHVKQEAVQRARECGYKGDDLAGAKEYLKLLKSIDTLVEEVIPEACVQRGKRSFVDFEATLSSIQDLSEEEQTGVKVELNRALHCNIFKWNAAACKALLQLGADIENRDQANKALLQLGKDIKNPDQEGFTPLSIAVLSDNKDMVEFLIQNGANVNSTYLGDTLLKIVIRRNLDMARLLLENGAKASIDRCNEQQGTSGFGLNALHILALAKDKKDKIEAVELLIKYGANTETPSHVGLTALGLAEHFGNEAIVEVLRRG
jgi:hypothetical protein